MDSSEKNWRLHIGRPPDLYNKEQWCTLAYGNQQKNSAYSEQDAENIIMTG